MCETANQQSISSHRVVYMACKMRCRWLTFRRCFVNPALSRNRSLRDAKPARHLFVWFAKHCLAERCLSFRGDADECEKQFCFVFRICLAFFDSGLWRPLHTNMWFISNSAIQTFIINKSPNIKTIPLFSIPIKSLMFHK